MGKYIPFWQLKFSFCYHEILINCIATAAALIFIKWLMNYQALEHFSEANAAIVVLSILVYFFSLVEHAFLVSTVAEDFNEKSIPSWILALALCAFLLCCEGIQRFFGMLYDTADDMGLFHRYPPHKKVKKEYIKLTYDEPAYLDYLLHMKDYSVDKQIAVINSFIYHMLSSEIFSPYRSNDSYLKTATVEPIQHVLQEGALSYQLKPLYRIPVLFDAISLLGLNDVRRIFAAHDGWRSLFPKVYRVDILTQ